MTVDQWWKELGNSCMVVGENVSQRTTNSRIISMKGSIISKWNLTTIWISFMDHDYRHRWKNELGDQWVTRGEKETGDNWEIMVGAKSVNLEIGIIWEDFGAKDRHLKAGTSLRKKNENYKKWHPETFTETEPRSSFIIIPWLDKIKFWKLSLLQRTIQLLLHSTSVKRNKMNFWKCAKIMRKLRANSHFIMKPIHSKFIFVNV